MSVKSKIKEVFEFIEDLILTNHKCLGCGKEISDRIKTGICDECQSKIEVLTGDLCSKCGEVVVEGNKLCDACKSVEYYFDESKSYAIYGDVTAAIVKDLKYGRRKYYAKYIAYMLSQNKKYFEGVDYIAFVPMGKERFKERGFNQAEEIAKHVSNKVGVPIVDVLVKIKENTHQAGLSRKERVKNIVGTIAIKEDIKNIVKGKTVLLIDDVFTTGSTLSECAKALKKSGCTKVKSLTFAKTRQNLI